MTKNLVIVESPAKAKTIERYLGKDYQVLSSFGHIRDLPKKHLNIDVDNGFKPTYEISADKKKIVSNLKKHAENASEIWLASDEDREGEAIAWHLCYALKLDPKQTKRIVFHEITKSAIEYALEHPRNIDIDLVNAQQARRILDRLVGYELSPVLWKKVRPQLSAGRVQSVAVRLIVDREREIKNFEASSEYRISAIFNAKTTELPAELNQKYRNLEQAKEFLEACKDAIYIVDKIDKKPSKRSPSTPFTTSTLQQEAARQLGFSVKQTMSLAQRLYETGIITYMRTDSPTLSTLAINNAKAHIIKEYGANYYQYRQFKSKHSSAQEAHEAIRPTNFIINSVKDNWENKLYQLIWKRTIASQMQDAILERTEVTIAISKRAETFQTKGEIVVFDGFLKVTGKAGQDVLLPDLNLNDKLINKRIIVRETYSKPKARYSEASLVKKLEELGIGRPSTYAPTISTIQARGYIERKDLDGNERKAHQLVLENNKIAESSIDEVYGADRNKLIPTSTAEVTTDFLTKYFEPIVDYNFTAKAEEDFDLIAEGKKEWPTMLSDFYTKFHNLIVNSDKVSRMETSQSRLIGNDPKTSRPIFVRFGRYGPMLQKGEATDDEKPVFASLPSGTTMDTVTIKEALSMFDLPKKVGTTKEGIEISANIGRFGPYIQIDKTYISIKPLDPRAITEKEARELIEKHRIKQAEKFIQEFSSGIKVLNGPYGPYITNGKKNAKIPKDKQAEKITEEEAKMILKDAPNKKRYFKKKKL
ncbi:MAG TPA: type I DNA topoisomerase [Candidatus Saccharimonadia bacterium]|nr:type I DNA topoisomerase [Candidatus Saccharimonadia bacterium]